MISKNYESEKCRDLHVLQYFQFQYIPALFCFVVLECTILYNIYVCIVEYRYIHCYA